MSLTLIATRSMPMVSCFFIRKASLSFVPTPSVPETITGFWYFFETSKSAPKPPMPPSTSGRMRALGERLDALDEGVTGFDVDAGVAIRHGMLLAAHGCDPVDLEAKFYRIRGQTT